MEEWYHFKNGRMSVESEARSDKPFTSQNKEVIEKVSQIVMEDHCPTLRKIVEEVGISKESVHSILIEDLRLQSVGQRYVNREELAASP